VFGHEGSLAQKGRDKYEGLEKMMSEYLDSGPFRGSVLT
jgi:hypothetical protein